MTKFNVFFFFKGVLMKLLIGDIKIEFSKKKMQIYRLKNDNNHLLFSFIAVFYYDEHFFFSINTMNILTI